MVTVIGAGLGRTGTLSTKAALERLTGGRSYHMYEALSHLEHMPVWLAADAGDSSGLRDVLADYTCTVDWPGCSLWRELADLFPDARVLLSVRPPQRWWASYRDTIHQLMLRDVPSEAEVGAEMHLLSHFGSTMTKRSFPPDYSALTEQDFLAAYERHNEQVRTGIEPQRLLEFDVEQGWEPLCTFLGVPAPEEPFPRLNDRSEFRALFGLDEPAERDPDAEPYTREEIETHFGEALPPRT